MEQNELYACDEAYWRTLDAQIAPYELYARRNGLTEKELFVLAVVWRSGDGCPQSWICERLSATKQTVSAIVKKFRRLGYLSLTGSESDRRNKIVRLTGAGTEYAQRLVEPLLSAQVAAMAELCPEDREQLLRTTALLSRSIQRKFAPLLEETSPCPRPESGPDAAPNIPGHDPQ